MAASNPGYTEGTATYLSISTFGLLPIQIDEEPGFFKRWYFCATHSRLAPVIRVAKSLKAHLDGILRHIESGLSNGLLEGLNSLIQSAKSRARGFRSPENMATIIYLLLGKLDFKMPGVFPRATHMK